MASVKSNVIANSAGSALSALIGLAVVPFYIRLMGAEAYGIVGVFVSLQAMLAVFDLGLSQTLSREMARLSVDRGNAGLMADTTRTLEIIYWGIALAGPAVIALFSHFIAYQWLNPETLSRESLLEALWVMAIVIGLRWPAALYMGGLNGLQRQVLLNVLLGITATLQAVGALIVLWFVEPTVRAFFMWQALIAVLQVFALRTVLWHSLKSERNGRFCKDVLSKLWRFAAGMSGISLLATILTQLDKVLLSKLLSLSEFGYYTFAAAVAAVLYRLIGPIFTAYYPRLTELVSKDDDAGLSEVYHQGCQLMAVAILPVTLTLAFFSLEILELWTRDPGIVAHSYLLVSILVVGNALNGLMHLPYALQLAHGWTRFGFYTNLVAVIVLAPAIYFATKYWGVVGAAFAWVLLNLGYSLVGIQIMHRRLLINEKWRWYWGDVGKPLLVVILVIGIGRILMGSDIGDVQKATKLAAFLGLAVAGALIVSESLQRKFMFQQFSRTQ